MVGNDVVDLSDSEARPGASHPRFDARVFCASEREALRASPTPDRLRWMFWAAKEAAYKLVKRRNPSAVFSPRRFIVKLDAALSGVVHWRDEAIPVEFEAGPDSVHAVATEPGVDSSHFVSGLATATPGEDASLEVRDLAVRTVAAHLGTPPGDLTVERSGRVPTLRLRGAPMPVALSLSHHGRFVAFACDLRKLRR